MKPSVPFLEVVPGSWQADPELERVLSAARAVAEPEPAHRARVAAALRHEIAAAGSAIAPSRDGSSELAEPPASARQVPVPPKTVPRVVWTPLVCLLLGGAVLGPLGFWLGHNLGRAERGREASDPVAPAEPSASSPWALAADPALSVPSDSGPAVRPVTGPPVPAALVSNAKPARRSAGATSALHATQRDERTMSFREVLEQLSRARQQLAGGQATLSLLLLSELDRGAGEILREEREMTRVLALCATGQQAAARRSATQLEQLSPHSIYALRLSSSCVSRGEP